MKFNPEKCYVIHVTKKKIPLKLDYKLHSHTLQTVDNSKYLDVTISNDLEWDPHINNITSKANKTLGFLRRNMKTVHLRPHHLFVRLTNTLHQFGIHLKNIKYLRLSKYKGKQLVMSLMTTVTARSPGAVTNMIDTLQWDSLACKRTKASLILLYKINGGFSRGTNNHAIPI